MFIYLKKLDSHSFRTGFYEVDGYLIGIKHQAMEIVIRCFADSAQQT